MNTKLRFKWNLVVFVIMFAQLKMSEESFFIDEDCILFLNSSNKTNKFNLNRSTNLVSTEIDSTMYETDTFITLEFCEKPSGNCNGYSCLHFKENGTTVYIGTDLTNAKFQDDLLKLMFTGSHKCNTDSYYSTSILLACRRDGEEQIIFEKYEDCNFSLLWFSSVGCPLKEFSVVNSCVISTHTTSFDLRPLFRPSGYSIIISPKRSRLNFNVCGYLKHSFCGSSNYLCEISDLDDQVLATSKEYTLEMIDETVSIIFKNVDGNGDKFSTVINLVCKSGVTEPILKFARLNKKSASYLVMYTSIVCKSPLVKCQISDEDVEYSYDLSELQKLSGNWKVSDKIGNTIIFNFCSTLNYEPELGCSGGNIFSCLKTHYNKTYSLGTYQEVAVIRRGYLSFNYSGGSICKDNELFSQSVTLVCSNKNFDPVLSKTSDCTYSLKWNTMAACPVKYLEGDRCIVNDINLNNLFNGKPWRVKDSKNGSFFINLCKPVKCNGEENVTICWTDDKKNEYSIGYYPSKPVFSNGRIKFVIFGKPCKKSETKSVVIFELKCDYNGRQTYPTFISQSENCVFHFNWYTDIVCPNKTVAKCKIEDQFGVHDVTPLMRNRTNYVINSKSASFYINICQSVVPGPGVRCGKISEIGICIFNHTTFEETHLGLVSQPLQRVNNSLQLFYSSEEVCTDGDKPSYSAIIKFNCDSEMNTSELTSWNYDNCVYIFDWPTPLACSMKPPRTVHSVNAETTTNSVIVTSDIVTNKPKTVTKVPNIVRNTSACVAENPHNKWRFNLTPLMEKDWIIDSTLTISICRPLLSNNCSPTSGSCLMNSRRKFINMGNANDDLRFEDGVLYLNYTGENCKNTIIYFSCHEESKPSEIEDFDHCTSIIHWATPLACQSDVGKLCCEKEEDALCHLRDTYIMEVQKKTVHLNICKIPKPQPELSCSKEKECVGTKLPYSNLFVNQGLISSSNVNQNKTISLELQHIFGEICFGRIHKMYSISLKLYCDNKLKEITPRFLSVDERCTYNFEWNSSLFCKNVTSKNYTDMCNSSRNTKRELSKFHSLSTRTAVSMKSGNSYYFSFCDNSSICKSDICIRKQTSLWDDYATMHHISSGRNPNTTLLYYTLLKNNTAGFCGAEVTMICNYGAEEGEPIISSESACHLEVIWKTKYACVEELKSAKSPAGIVITTIFIVTVVSFTVAYLIWKKWHYISFIPCQLSSRYREGYDDDNVEL
ncbi:lysosomal enzyme receptor protein isoform X1 [Rhodnius prolixus]|uniref:lysosomal enzyme receptor protein isoform X1 n=1 Tax=Rhodnius prolixus TaxID=13249 RepID=UPI003D18D1FE